MDDLEELLRETLRERATNAPAGARVIEAVRGRTPVSLRRPRLVAVLVAMLLVIAIVATAAIATTVHHHGSEPRGPIPPGVTTPSTAPQPTTAPPPTPPTTVSAQPTAACVHAVPTKIGPRQVLAVPPGATSMDYDRRSALQKRLGISVSVLVAGRSGSRGGGIVEIRRDGAVYLARGSAPFGEFLVQAVGDFNGDGRPDLLIDIGDPPTTSYVVSGDLAPGTYDLTKVGSVVPVPQGNALFYVEVVGDQNHDGADDVLIDRAVYSGRQIMADAPRHEFPPPFEVFAATPVGLFQVNAHEPPSFVVPDAATTSLRVTDKRADRLVLSRQDFAFTTTNGAFSEGWVANGHHFLDYRHSSRGGDNIWVWDLDGPCAK